MIGWSKVHRQVSYMYSYPNFIPLHPKAIVQIWNSISPYNFEDAYDTWPGRRLVGGARKEIFDQLDPFLDCQGISAKDVELRPL